MYFFSIEAYSELKAKIAAARATAKANPRQYGNVTFENELGAIEKKYNEGAYADSEIPAVANEVKGITNRYLMADAVALATAENPVDVTFMVSNPSFDGDSYASWTASPAPGMGYYSAEFFNTNFNIYQTLVGMPAGTYRFQTRGFYRYGGQPENYAAHNNGTLKRNAKLYITHSTEGTQMADVMAISDDPSEDIRYGGWSSELYDGKPVPNNMQAGAHAIDGYNKYVPKDGLNSVVITVDEIGDLTFGAKKETLVTNDWTFFGDFSLYYLGDGEHTLALDEETSLPAIDENVIYDKVTVERTIKAPKEGEEYGNWNTFVVPFDMEIPDGWQVKTLTGSKQNGENITLTFDDAGAIEAGVPYMVRTKEAVSTITEQMVEVCTTLANTSTDHVEFVGVYGAGNIPAGAFFISSNVFYQAADDNNTIKAFRAYFVLKNAANARSLSYRFGDDYEEGTTDIEVPEEEVTVVGIYTLSGVRLNEMQQGINILQMSDGTTRKVIIK